MLINNSKQDAATTAKKRKSMHLSINVSEWHQPREQWWAPHCQCITDAPKTIHRAITTAYSQMHSIPNALARQPIIITQFPSLHALLHHTTLTCQQATPWWASHNGGHVDLTQVWVQSETPELVKISLNPYQKSIHTGSSVTHQESRYKTAWEKMWWMIFEDMKVSSWGTDSQHIHHLVASVRSRFHPAVIENSNIFEIQWADPCQTRARPVSP